MKVLPGKTTLNWSECKSYEDILFHTSDDGIARIAINRPEKRNAFRPQTVYELINAFNIVRNDETIGVVLFTGAGPDKKGIYSCLLYTSPSPRDAESSRMPSSA